MGVGVALVNNCCRRRGNGLTIVWKSALRSPVGYGMSPHDALHRVVTALGALGLLSIARSALNAKQLRRHLAAELEFWQVTKWRRPARMQQDAGNGREHVHCPPRSR